MSIPRRRLLSLAPPADSLGASSFFLRRTSATLQSASDASKYTSKVPIDGALPATYNAPACCPKLPVHGPVTLHIAADLRCPPLRARRKKILEPSTAPALPLARISVPEITIDKYRHPQANERNVRSADDTGRMNAVAKSESPELFADCQLRSRVLRPDTSHDSRSYARFTGHAPFPD